ncbi:AI-2E family transporter [Xanthocytophaga agilis]|uniref:AI-2E family transporter n=1 Tax=Xanthocytophaga agilis TaxID=3048010 RepID=A0AAE3UE80_9BACT|nr:AI-2E family transporter [Xanthocytophaga agilis]MDJ1499967.1 AI-2E family transporter [Xanthocytophaga agilis]
MSSPYTRKQRKGAMLVLIILLFCFLAYALRGFITSFFGALIIYTLFRSWHQKLVEQRKWKPALSTTIILIVSFLLIILPVGIVVYQVANQVVQLVKDPTVVTGIIAKIQHYPLYQKYVDPQLLQDQLSRIGQVAVNIFGTTLNGLANSIATISVMYLILYFMFAHYKAMETWLMQYLPFSPRNSYQYADELRNITYSNVIGSGIIAVIQGALVGLGFWLFGIPQPFFYGTIAVFASFIPVIGSALIFIPGSLFALASGETGHGIGLLLWGFILVANIDNVLRMVLNKKIGDTHPLITFLGIIVGLPIFGLTGLVIGPLLLSFFVLSVQMYTRNYLSKPASEKELEIKIVKEESEKSPQNPSDRKEDTDTNK